MKNITYLLMCGAVLLNSCKTISVEEVLNKHDVSFELYLSRVAYDTAGNSRPNLSAPRKMVLDRVIYDECENILVAAQCGKVTSFGEIPNKEKAVYLIEASDCFIWLDKNFQVLNFKADQSVEELLEINARKLIIEIAKQERGWLVK